MVNALIITNLIFNIFFTITCGLISYSVIKSMKKKKQNVVKKPDYKR